MDACVWVMMMMVVVVCVGFHLYVLCYCGGCNRRRWWLLHDV